MLSYAAFSVLVLIALAHSVLGELSILRPLLAKSWDIGIPRWAVDRVLRFAWHITSLAWVGLAATIIGLAAVHAMAGVCVVSGLLILVMLRGHLAWPLFLLAGALAWASQGVLPTAVSAGLAAVAAAVALVVAGVHVYWALGGRWGADVAIPQGESGKPAFDPGPFACLAVAGALVVLAGLLVWPMLAGTVPSWASWGLGLAALVMAARAVGDGRQVGFSKSNHETRFARADDALYTPLVVLLVFGTLGALHLG